MEKRGTWFFGKATEGREGAEVPKRKDVLVGLLNNHVADMPSIEEVLEPPPPAYLRHVQLFAAGFGTVGLPENPPAPLDPERTYVHDSKHGTLQVWRMTREGSHLADVRRLLVDLGLLQLKGLPNLAAPIVDILSILYSFWEAVAPADGAGDWVLIENTAPDGGRSLVSAEAIRRLNVEQGAGEYQDILRLLHAQLTGGEGR